MTMDLYGHLIDQNLWDASRKVAEHTRASRGPRTGLLLKSQTPRAREVVSDLGVWVEPPVGIEPTTFSLRVRSRKADRRGDRRS
jgi:hypothetical protein